MENSNVIYRFRTKVSVGLSLYIPLDNQAYYTAGLKLAVNLRFEVVP